MLVYISCSDSHKTHHSTPQSSFSLSEQSSYRDGSYGKCQRITQIRIGENPLEKMAWRPDEDYTFKQKVWLVNWYIVNFDVRIEKQPIYIVYIFLQGGKKMKFI